MNTTPLPAFIMAHNAGYARHEKALDKYGREACLEAYRMHRQGEGAHTIALTGPATIKTTRQADAAILAGEWVTSNERLDE